MPGGALPDEGDLGSENTKIGVLLEWSPSAYSRTLRAQLESEAARQNVTLTFIGVHWASASSDEGDDVEETLASAADCSGMILFSGVFSHRLHGLSRFAQNYAPKPLVSIGYRLAAVPSIVVDNRLGMQLAAGHLIAVHGRRKLLFIRGRKDSQEAEDRYLGFRHGLREHGILHEEKRVLQGDFTRQGALRALADMDPAIAYDGIVAANDDMALAVMADLRRRGLDVPGHVAVLGFDDLPEAARASIPLTTLAQPFESLAKTALTTIKTLTGGESVPAVQAVPVTLRTRQSCGCS